jgi:hypothetical protein
MLQYGSFKIIPLPNISNTHATELRAVFRSTYLWQNFCMGYWRLAIDEVI